MTFLYDNLLIFKYLTILLEIQLMNQQFDISKTEDGLKIKHLQNANLWFVINEPKMTEEIIDRRIIPIIRGHLINEFSLNLLDDSPSASFFAVLSSLLGLEIKIGEVSVGINPINEDEKMNNIYLFFRKRKKEIREQIF